ncbi:excalibur calcium-binding domain-containing protein [Pontibacillus salipaludis]
MWRLQYSRGCSSILRSCWGPEQDPHRLDGDGNGVACESLP